MKTLTLCFPIKEGRILLGMKKRGFGVGLWNGFGGKVDESESIEEAVVREVQEEINVTPQNIEKVGILEFYYTNEDSLLEVHIFVTRDFSGNPEETEEMEPAWFSFNAIPYSEMWPDDEVWLPHLLQGKKFRGRFDFDRPTDQEYRSVILKQTLAEVDHLS